MESNLTYLLIVYFFDSMCMMQIHLRIKSALAKYSMFEKENPNRR